MPRWCFLFVLVPDLPLIWRNLQGCNLDFKHNIDWTLFSRCLISFSFESAMLQACHVSELIVCLAFIWTGSIFYFFLHSIVCLYEGGINKENTIIFLYFGQSSCQRNFPAFLACCVNLCIEHSYSGLGQIYRLVRWSYRGSRGRAD